MATEVNAGGDPVGARSESAPGTDEDSRLPALLGEAQAAVAGSANVLRDVRERYRTAHREHVERWEALRDEVARSSASSHADPSALETHDSRNGSGPPPHQEETVAAVGVGEGQATLNRIDLAIRSLENAWLFLDPADASLVLDPSHPASAADAQMRILEAQEAERSRLAREIHDGPAQALSNAIFQVEIVERLLDRDERLARRELVGLREMLTRELRAVRAYLSQLRPPLLAELGLAGAIREAAEQIGSVLGIEVEVEVDDGIDGLPEPVEVVVLRVVQEALQNARRHAHPEHVRVRAVRNGLHWEVEVRDDGVGFDADVVAGTGRRSFGLQFMRERAELVGARFEVRSRPDLGTVVSLEVPWQEEDAQ